MKKVNWLAIIAWSVLFMLDILFWWVICIFNLLPITILALIVITVIIIKKEKL